MKKVLNIVLGALMVITLALVAYAIATGGSDAAISLNLVWGYILLVGAVVAAVGGALYSMMQSPAGAKSSLLAFVLILVVVGAAYFISAGHTVQIVDLQNNGFFAHGETVITETCILVTYVAFAAAVVTALVTEIWAAFK
ncbi:MAG: hypothetical protein IIX78_06590 [Alistipes sp.]|nr:hypothetical protein [Alistipes sp.]MBQ2392996.1 hypothetical protein [Alistipes sp.]